MLKKTYFIFFAYLLLGAAFYLLFFGTKNKGQTMDELAFYSENLPPFNYQVEGENHGLAIEMLEFILKENNSSKTVNNVEFHLWNQSYFKAISNPNAVLFSTTRTQEREAVFKWAGPILEVHRSLFSLKKDEKRVLNILHKRMHELKVAVLDNNIDTQILLKNGVVRANVASVPEVEKAIEMLEKGDIDAIMSNAPYFLHSVKEKRELFTLIKTLGSYYHYFAFNQQVDDRVVQNFQNAIDNFKKTDKYIEHVKRISNL